MNQRNQSIQEKMLCLKKYLKELECVAIAYSGGVDSTFLLKAAHDTLGDRVVAITARADFFPNREFQEAEEFCRKEGIRHLVCNMEAGRIEGFCENPSNRCYLCKKELFLQFYKLAREQNIHHIAEGSNMDDNGDYRPGMLAIAELQVKSPLRHAGFYKSEIRELSREMGLSTWEKQSFACLASRFVYGETITREKLDMVDKAEQLLLDKGFHQVRVRIHDKMARIEVMPEEFEKLMKKNIREEIVSKFKDFGFSYISMDLCGYRTGSMNEILAERTHQF